MMKTFAILLTSAAALAVACGSDSNPKMIDAKVFMDSPGSGSATKHLTVKNAPTATPWCSVTIAGGTAFTSGSMSVAITANGPITLTAAPQNGFMLASGMWHHTDGDTGAGDSGTVASGTSTATVTVSTTADKCVWVCCPGTGFPCPTTDQCP